MEAQGKRVRGVEVGEGRAEKRRWERRELGIGGGAENSGELSDEDHQGQERRDQSYCPRNSRPSMRFKIA